MPCLYNLNQSLNQDVEFNKKAEKSIFNRINQANIDYYLSKDADEKLNDTNLKN